MNTVGYFEIQANDPPKAIEFYSDIFGWKFMKQDGLPIEYWHIQTEGPSRPTSGRVEAGLLANKYRQLQRLIQISPLPDPPP